MRIIIVGGGFAGTNLAKALKGKKEFEVVLVDKNNYHFFPPLLYQVATSFIHSSIISYPFRRMFQKADNIRFYYGMLTNINAQQKTIDTDNGTLTYDYLVLAMGTETNYFGLQNVRENALPMKTIDDALKLRNALLENLEKATKCTDKLEQKALMTVVIAGGGPTGVEVAGMLAEMGKLIKDKDYPELNGVKGDIYLVDSSKTLLSPMSSKSQAEAYKQLDRLGVKILLQTTVKDYVNNTVLLSSGKEISCQILIWATGVVARTVTGLPAESIGRGKRILVDAFNKVQDTDSIFAIGDICLQTTDSKYPNGHPQLAQVAIQQGKSLAKNFKNISQGKKLIPFHYLNKGTMAIISKYKAVVDLPGLFYKGFFAWFTWLFVHIIPLAGFRNRLMLAYNWFWSFITNDPVLRLIVRPQKTEE
jgi:NADH dehydrogenase